MTRSVIEGVGTTSRGTVTWHVDKPSASTRRRRARSARRIAELVGLATLALYVSSIVFFKRLESGFRVEDYLLPVLTVSTMSLVSRSVSNHLRGPALYIGWSAAVTMVAIASTHLPISALLIWGKETQYLLGFCLLLGLFAGREQRVLQLKPYLLALCGWGCCYTVYSVVTGNLGYYGLGYYNEMDSPSLNAWMYFNLFVMAVLLRRAFDLRKAIAIPLVGCLFCAVLLTGSRTGQITIIAFSVLYLYTSGSRRSVLLAAALFGAVLVAFGEWSYEIIAYLEDTNPIAAGAASRFQSLLTFAQTIEASRYATWQLTWDKWLNGNILFGCGRGCNNLSAPGVIESLVMGGDNQYTRNLQEIGVIGQAIFAGVLLGLILAVGRPFRGMYGAYVAAYALGGMTMEVWQLSKPGQLFWLISALFLVLGRARLSVPLPREVSAQARPSLMGISTGVEVELSR